ncbi:uncharacterized protein Dvar_61250 [Desulfosarcina variabilis str. Montpellier]
MVLSIFFYHKDLRRNKLTMIHWIKALILEKVYATEIS